tara:strand:- start:6639 stop:6989 length:351 start_codon:yes stop_codon:yes gene_type:complete
MPKLVRFMAFHAGVGFAVALASVTAILAFDISHLRTLILSSDIKWLATLVLVILMTITLASVTMGIAIMRLPHRPEDDDQNNRGLRQHALVDHFLGLNLIRPQPVRVKVEDRRISG